MDPVTAFANAAAAAFAFMATPEGQKFADRILTIIDKLHDFIVAHEPPHKA